ncbi:MFS transporter [Reichenbachiella versicolor]|uniref:MFS transporter n=1 Tax=Reichenbachiella versicolor TaxID=1821036 RepID=UPI001FE9930A|nr:MFS transporter [Reichenbachiella versicolor]
MQESARIKNAWCMYDWANSAYLLVISSTIFPIYYNGITRRVFGGDEVTFFGFQIENTVLYSYAISFSFLVSAALSPLLSGVADYGGKRKFFLKVFTYLGSFSTLSLFWFKGDNIEFGIIMSVFAAIGYSGSLVFYNAFLPEITSEENYNMLSAKGYALGYIGSVLLLLASFILIEMYQTFGFEEKTSAVRLSFLFVGVWWLGFAQFAFRRLPENNTTHSNEVGLLRKGAKEVVKVFDSLKHSKVLKRYLMAFFFYSMGVQTIMHLATIFGEKELGLSAAKLIVTIIVLQLVAIGGAYLFSKLSKRYNDGVSILLMLIIWIGICVFSYVVKTEYEFYALAVLVGIVMGGIQSMSRSTYSKLIPENSIDNTSYFSFYDVLEKSSIVLGTFSFGFIEYISGSMRNSTLVLTVFFIVGVFLLVRSGIHRKAMA